MHAINVLTPDGEFLCRCSKKRAKNLTRRHKMAVWVGTDPPTIRLLFEGLTGVTLTQPLTTKLYGNIHVLSPGGDLMFNCNQDKMEWYLARGLAERVTENTIRLNFIPAGPGHQGDEFYLATKENRCVVCGTERRLTRHHIIPYCYRRHFPDELKMHSHHDVALLCVPCHDRYESEANKFKKQIAAMYGVPLHGRGLLADHDLRRIRNFAGTLLRHGDKIPEHRRSELLAAVLAYIGKEDVADEDLLRVSRIEYHVKTGDYAQHGEYVVRNTPDLEQFVKDWRRHFLDTMRPAYMPNGWDVDRTIYKTANRNGVPCVPTERRDGDESFQIPKDAAPALERLQDGG